MILKKDGASKMFEKQYSKIYLNMDFVFVIVG